MKNLVLTDENTLRQLIQERHSHSHTIPSWTMHDMSQQERGKVCKGFITECKELRGCRLTPQTINCDIS